MINSHYACTTTACPNSMGTTLACMQSRPVSHWKRVAHYEVQDKTMETQTVDQMKLYIKQEWEEITPTKLQQFVSLVPKHFAPTILK